VKPNGKRRLMWRQSSAPASTDCIWLIGYVTKWACRSGSRLKHGILSSQLGFSSLDDFITNFMFGYLALVDPNDLLCMA